MAISLRKLLAISTQLTVEACSIANKLVKGNKCNPIMKGQDDVVTEADFLIQNFLTKGFQMHFPYLEIIGEETSNDRGIPNFDFDSLRQDFYPKDNQINYSIDSRAACLWIDPIDCTRGFVAGDFQDVTILIGLSLNNQAIFGVIGSPFQRVKGVINYNPVVTVGSVPQMQTYRFKQQQWEKITKKPKNNPLIVATSSTRPNEAQKNFISSFQAGNVQAGGSGRKIMMVVDGQADIMAYLDSWTHKWDSCAGEAIVKSLGGFFTDPLGQPIIYDRNKEDTENREGLLVSMNADLHAQAVRIIKMSKK